MALIIDVETIGLPVCNGKYPPYDSLPEYENARVVQMTMMLCDDNWEQLELFDFIIKADGFDIANSTFHGITNEISSERGIPFQDIALILSEQLKKVTKIMAHNAHFDIFIIKSELFRISMHSIIEEINSKEWDYYYNFSDNTFKKLED